MLTSLLRAIHAGAMEVKWTHHAAAQILTAMCPGWDWCTILKSPCPSIGASQQDFALCGYTGCPCLARWVYSLDVPHGAVRCGQYKLQVMCHRMTSPRVRACRPVDRRDSAQTMRSLATKVRLLASDGCEIRVRSFYDQATEYTCQQDDA